MKLDIIDDPNLMNQIDRVTSNLRYFENEYWQKETELSRKDIVNDFK